MSNTGRNKFIAESLKIARKPVLTNTLNGEPHPIGKDFFGRRQNFSLIGSTCTLQHLPEKKRSSLYSRTDTPDLPTWLLFDKQALKFDAYFQQSLFEMQYGPSIIRTVKILFFLEDGTIKVVEAKTDNSGLCQGTIVKRHRIPLNDGSDEFYDVINLNVGQHVNIYGKVFLIFDCDQFTRVFLNRLGIRVPDRLDIPQLQKNSSDTKSKSAFRERRPSQKQFYEFDRKVLRFSGHWDDRQSEGGTLHHLEIFYYLSDDTIQIKEVFGPAANSKKKETMFLQRASLPKSLPKGLRIPDGSSVEAFGPSDMFIGSPLDVYGRMVVLTDCDPFTREYYRIKYGVEDFSPISPPEPLVAGKNIYPPPKVLPPWNGHGTHKDSAGNCLTILPKASHRDFTKFYEKDRIGMESHILKFWTKLISKIPEYDARQFILSYYLCDDTISVFECGVRNSGYTSGMFFKRAPVMMPGQDMFQSNEPLIYSTKDIWVGNVLLVNDHHFLLTGADEYTLRYMALNPYEFPKSNVRLIMDKIKTDLLSRENGYKDFVAKNMSQVVSEEKHLMPKHMFEQALKEIMCDSLMEQEFITIARYFQDSIDEQPKPRRDTIRTLVFSDLRRNLWQENDCLLLHFRYLDENNTDVLSWSVVRQALKAVQLPIKDELMSDMLDLIEKNPDGGLYYRDVMDFLDFKLKPVQSLLAIPATSSKRAQDTECPRYKDNKICRDVFIDFEKFIKYLDLEPILSDKP